jgi:general secretion pathway protein B
MSLILEALRKSEAERQVGRAPGLMTPMSTPRRRSTAPLWLFAAVLLLAAAGAGWWFGRPAAPVTTPMLQPVPAAVDEAVPPPSIGDESAPRPAAPQGVGDAIRPVPDARPAAPAAPAPAVLRRDPAPAAAPAPAAVPPPAAVVPPAPAPLPVPPAAIDHAATAAPDAIAPALEALPGLHAIDADRRGRLPPLRMSLHMYADAVENRFVLIDGRRYGEGMVIEPGLEVAEIRRDGVVIAVDGQRVLLTSR